MEIEGNGKFRWSGDTSKARGLHPAKPRWKTAEAGGILPSITILYLVYSNRQPWEQLIGPISLRRLRDETWKSRDGRWTLEESDPFPTILVSVSGFGILDTFLSIQYRRHCFSGLKQWCKPWDLSLWPYNPQYQLVRACLLPDPPAIDNLSAQRIFHLRRCQGELIPRIDEQIKRIWQSLFFKPKENTNTIQHWTHVPYTQANEVTAAMKPDTHPTK